MLTLNYYLLSSEMTSKLECWRTVAPDWCSLFTLWEAPTLFWDGEPKVKGEPFNDLISLLHTITSHKECITHSSHILGRMSMAGWSFLWPRLLSCCFCFRFDGTTQVFSSWGSTQLNVLRSAWVLSTLLIWLPQRATWAASFISSVVSSALRKE